MPYVVEKGETETKNLPPASHLARRQEICKRRDPAMDRFWICQRIARSKEEGSKGGVARFCNCRIEQEETSNRRKMRKRTLPDKISQMRGPERFGHGAEAERSPHFIRRERRLPPFSIDSRGSEAPKLQSPRKDIHADCVAVRVVSRSLLLRKIRTARNEAPESPRFQSHDLCRRRRSGFSLPKQPALRKTRSDGGVCKSPEDARRPGDTHAPGKRGKRRIATFNAPGVANRRKATTISGASSKTRISATTSFQLARMREIKNSARSSSSFAIFRRNLHVPIARGASDSISHSRIAPQFGLQKIWRNSPLPRRNSKSKILEDDLTSEWSRTRAVARAKPRDLRIRRKRHRLGRRISECGLSRRLVHIRIQSCAYKRKRDESHNACFTISGKLDADGE